MPSASGKLFAGAREGLASMSMETQCLQSALKQGLPVLTRLTTDTGTFFVDFPLIVFPSGFSQAFISRGFIFMWLNLLILSLLFCNPSEPCRVPLVPSHSPTQPPLWFIAWHPPCMVPVQQGLWAGGGEEGTQRSTGEGGEERPGRPVREVLCRQLPGYQGPCHLCRCLSLARCAWHP